MPSQRPARDPLWWLSATSLGLLAFALLFLAAYCVAEMFATPGSSLIDAYWRGRLPWMGIAETLIVTGASAAAVTGGVAVLWVGGWARRLLAIPALLAVAFWWLLGIMGLPGGGPCLPSPCPPQPIDPWAVAYSAPEEAFLFLILPSALLALLALVARRTAEVPALT